MKRGEKSSEGPAQKQENLWEKLKRVGGKRGGQTTPVLPSWRLLQQLPPPPLTGGAPPQNILFKEETITPFPPALPSASARKLAATRWELNHYNLPLSKMHHRRDHQNHRRHHHHHHFLEDNPADPSPGSPDLPSASSLRRQVATSLMQHHRAVQRNHHALQPVSPASYGSSMEVAPYNPAVTPTSSIDFKGGGIGETSYSLKTSTELLKVLNRIWSLEEQHASNITLVRALKKELDLARAKVKELVRDRQTDRLEIDELMKQISEEKQDRVSSAIQSVRDELEDERKLRKRSETLHRKLARELYEVKTSLVNMSKDLERERKSRKLLEELCDEFAWGIKYYEQEMHALKHKPEKEKEWTYRADSDGLILHISESWLDERMQIKQQITQEKYSVVDKLSSEIETFLEAKRNGRYKSRGPTVRRNSLEPIPLNVAASAPRDEGDEDASSASSDSHCFELEKPIGVEFKPQLGIEGEEKKKKFVQEERAKGHIPTNLQVKFEEQMAQANAILGNGVRNREEGKEEMKSGEENQVEMSLSKKYEICEETEEGANEIRGSTSNYIDTLIRSHYLLSQNGNTKPENENNVDSVWRNRASPVRQWATRLPTEDFEISESSSKLPPNLKENTLKEKLLEARTRGQRSRSRLKASKVSF